MTEKRLDQLDWHPCPQGHPLLELQAEMAGANSWVFKQGIGEYREGNADYPFSTKSQTEKRQRLPIRGTLYPEDIPRG